MKQTDIFRNLDKKFFHIVQDLDEIFFVLEQEVDELFFSPLNNSQNEIIASQFYVCFDQSWPEFILDIYGFDRKKYQIIFSKITKIYI